MFVRARARGDSRSGAASLIGSTFPQCSLRLRPRVREFRLGTFDPREESSPVLRPEPTVRTGRQALGLRLVGHGSHGEGSAIGQQPLQRVVHLRERVVTVHEGQTTGRHDDLPPRSGQVLRRIQVAKVGRGPGEVHGHPEVVPRPRRVHAPSGAAPSRDQGPRIPTWWTPGRTRPAGTHLTPEAREWISTELVAGLPTSQPGNDAGKAFRARPNFCCRGGVLRFHFTTPDLSAVQIAGRLDPLWEATLSVQALQAPAPSRTVKAWRRSAGQRVTDEMRPVRQLVPPGGGFPDFLAPDYSGAGVEERIDAVLDTSTARMRDEIGSAAARPSGWLTELCRGSHRAKHQLGTALRSVHQNLLTPVRPGRERAFGSDRNGSMQDLADGGLARLMSGLTPFARWEPSVLTFDCSNGSDDVDVHLDGRGVTLYFSPFIRERPGHDRVVYTDIPGQRPVLVIPGALRAPGTSGARGLDNLMGVTRARVLRALVQPSSTSTLAAQLTISKASASEHARVLREAGLVATRRDAHSVVHSLTPLGQQLLGRTRT